MLSSRIRLGSKTPTLWKRVCWVPFYCSISAVQLRESSCILANLQSATSSKSVCWVQCPLELNWNLQSAFLWQMLHLKMLVGFRFPFLSNVSGTFLELSLYICVVQLISIWVMSSLLCQIQSFIFLTYPSEKGGLLLQCRLKLTVLTFSINFWEFKNMLKDWQSTGYL